jgi:hypothetical protein
LPTKSLNFLYFHLWNFQIRPKWSLSYTKLTICAIYLPQTSDHKSIDGVEKKIQYATKFKIVIYDNCSFCQQPLSALMKVFCGALILCTVSFRTLYDNLSIVAVPVYRSLWRGIWLLVVLLFTLGWDHCAASRLIVMCSRQPKSRYGWLHISLCSWYRGE